MTEEEMAALGLEWWGSYCRECCNATFGTMQCDACDSTLATRKLWKESDGT